MMHQIVQYNSCLPNIYQIYWYQISHQIFKPKFGRSLSFYFKKHGSALFQDAVLENQFWQVRPFHNKRPEKSGLVQGKGVFKFYTSQNEWYFVLRRIKFYFKDVNKFVHSSWKMRISLNFSLWHCLLKMLPRTVFWIINI